DPLCRGGTGLAVRRGRGAVVENAPVCRPGVGPVEVRAGPAVRVGLAAGGPVLPLLRIDGAVDPGRAGRRAVVLQVAEGRQQLSGVALVAVDLLEDLERV